MKTKALLFLLIFSVTSVASAQVVQGADANWQSVGPGIDYQEFHLSDPNNVYVARMERDNPNLTLESSIAQGKVSRGLEAVSSMAARYDQAINYWGEAWGGRNRVVVAINGSYYNTSTGEPFQGMIHSGWYMKRFWDGENNSGFAWKLDRSVFIGGCVHHPEEKQLVVFLDDGKTQEIDGINVSRGDNQLILYTPHYDNHTHTDEFGVEVVVEMTRPSMVLPLSDLAIGYVREIHKNLGSTYLQFDQVVLSAQGDARTKLLNNIKIGDKIGITHKINNCQDSDDQQDWSKTYASVGTGFHYLKGGVIQSFPDNFGATYRHPRTAIAYNDDYIYFIVIDGRSAVSIGMTIDELAAFSKDVLAATDGVSLDGGGSSTMVVNGMVKNVPSDTCSLSGESLLLDVDPLDQREELLERESGDEIYAMIGCERWVANGMLMVVVEPMERSKTFKPGGTVKTPMPVEVRLGPGTNYAAFAIVPSGTEGIVLEHMNGLNGVLAKGDYWWKIAFDETVGWVSESSFYFQTWLSLILR